METISMRDVVGLIQATKNANVNPRSASDSMLLIQKLLTEADAGALTMSTEVRSALESVVRQSQ